MVSSNNKIVSSRFFEQSQFEQFTMSPMIVYVKYDIAEIVHNTHNWRPQKITQIIKTKNESFCIKVQLEISLNCFYKTYLKNCFLQHCLNFQFITAVYFENLNLTSGPDVKNKIRPFFPIVRVARRYFRMHKVKYYKTFVRIFRKKNSDLFQITDNFYRRNYLLNSLRIFGAITINTPSFVYNFHASPHGDLTILKTFFLSQWFSTFFRLRHLFSGSFQQQLNLALLCNHQKFNYLLSIYLLSHHLLMNSNCNAGTVLRFLTKCSRMSTFIIFINCLIFK